MKKTIPFLVALLFLNTINSQVLYDEKFDYFLGRVSNDPDGLTSGQGNWFTGSIDTKNPNFFTIINDLPPRDKVLLMSCPPSEKEALLMTRKELGVLIDSRESGNDVIKFEMSFFFRHHGFAHTYSIGLSSLNNENDNSRLIGLRVSNNELGLWVHNSGGLGNFQPLPVDVPYNKWVKLIAYLDYTNSKVYYQLPYFNTVYQFDLLVNRSIKTLEGNKPNLISLLNVGEEIGPNYMYNKYDNIKITALKSVPPEVIALSVDDVLSQKFNLYPNPATNVVNITNNESMFVEQVAIYDVAGKQLSAQTFNNENEIELNVSNLSSGVYMLHIETNEGTAVKKLIKK